MKKRESDYDGLPPAAFNMEEPTHLPLVIGQAYLAYRDIVVITGADVVGGQVLGYFGFKWRGAYERIYKWDTFGNALDTSVADISGPAELPLDLGHVYRDAAGYLVTILGYDEVKGGRIYEGLREHPLGDSICFIKYKENGFPTADYAEAAQLIRIEEAREFVREGRKYENASGYIVTISKKLYDPEGSTFIGEEWSHSGSTSSERVYRSNGEVVGARGADRLSSRLVAEISPVKEAASVCSSVSTIRLLAATRIEDGIKLRVVIDAKEHDFYASFSVGASIIIAIARALADQNQH